MHLQNDWLAGMWIFLVATGLCLFVTIILLIDAIEKGSGESIFIYSFGYVVCLYV